MGRGVARWADNCHGKHQWAIFTHVSTDLATTAQGPHSLPQAASKGLYLALGVAEGSKESEAKGGN